jgi:hypothetical protein
MTLNLVVPKDWSRQTPALSAEVAGFEISPPGYRMADPTQGAAMYIGLGTLILIILIILLIA